MKTVALAMILLLSAPAAAQDGLDPENSPETVPAIVSRKPVDLRLAWRSTGTGAPLRVDYDADGVPDVARLVWNGRHVAVRVTSGRTGRTTVAWLIDSRKGLAPDVHLRRQGRHSIGVLFPESTEVILFREGGRPMATYLNG